MSIWVSSVDFLKAAIFFRILESLFYGDVCTHLGEYPLIKTITLRKFLIRAILSRFLNPNYKEYF